eukprot:gene10030-biopygen1329
MRTEPDSAVAGRGGNSGKLGSLKSVLQDGGRNSEDGGRSTEGSVLNFCPPGRRTELEDGVRSGARFPRGRSSLRPQNQSSRTEDGDRGRSPVRSPVPRTRDGIHSVLRFRPPGRRTERVEIPSSGT